MHLYVRKRYLTQGVVILTRDEAQFIGPLNIFFWNKRIFYSANVHRDISPRGHKFNKDEAHDGSFFSDFSKVFCRNIKSPKNVKN